MNRIGRQLASMLRIQLHASDVEELSRLSARAEIAAEDMIASRLLCDVMSDNVSIADRNSQMGYFSQLNSSRASSDSANFVSGTAMNCASVWPPMNNSAIDWGDWPNSNGEQDTISDKQRDREHECKHGLRKDYDTSESGYGPAGLRSSSVCC